MDYKYKNENDFISDKSKLEIKIKFQNLWKEIFNDSDEYISLLFDTYFNKSMYEVCLSNDDDRLLSALLAIPYYFRYHGKEFKSLYLCGLSTREEYRGNGIMKTMINRVCERGESMGYAMAFLIPASDTLRRYYHFMGFTEGIGRVAERYVADHDFYREFANSLSLYEEGKRMKLLHDFRNAKREYAVEFDDNLIGECYRLISRNMPEKDVSIVHDKSDLKAVLKESVLSGGYVVLVKNSDSGFVQALATVYLDGSVKVVPHLWSQDQMSRMILLDAIMTRDPESSLLVWNSPGGVKECQLKENYFAGFDPEYPTVKEIGTDMGEESGSDRVVPYSMIRILSVSEILKFLGDSSDRQKFSILVKLHDMVSKEEKFVKFGYEDGTVKYEDIDSRVEGEFVTLPQLQNILFEPEKGEAAGILDLPHATLTAFDLLD